MQRYLITGATGFVGAHLAGHLWELGAHLRLLVRRSSDLTRLPAAIGQALAVKDPRVELFIGDLANAASLGGACEGVAGVYHLACAVKGTFDESERSRAVFHEVNVAGTENLAREAARAGVRMVHLSSTAAMGSVEESVVDEQTPCRPRALYQSSKRQAELSLLELHGSEGLDVVILRPCLILGPGKAGGEVLELFNLVRKGHFPKVAAALRCTKPLVDVRDVAQGCVRAMERGVAGEIYLIHSGARHTLGEIVAAAGALVGVRRTGVPVPMWPMRLAGLGFEKIAAAVPSFNPPWTRNRLDLFVTDRQISIEKARVQLGYAPAYQNVYDMLGMTYIGYVKDGQLRP
ncbi:MAG: NAD-dependent epimerase/dehydratase family protein [Bradymonadaceae bacterium]|nr:NAD-dependent epimerase/dehydratase family protein [Lujinxingiaceae bacterium]